MGVLPRLDTVELSFKCCDILKGNSELQCTYYSGFPDAVNNKSGAPASKRDVMTNAMDQSEVDTSREYLALTCKMLWNRAYTRDGGFLNNDFLAGFLVYSPIA